MKGSPFENLKGVDDTMKTQNFCFDWKNMGDNIQGEVMAYKVHYQ